LKRGFVKNGRKKWKRWRRRAKRMEDFGGLVFFSS